MHDSKLCWYGFKLHYSSHYNIIIYLDSKFLKWIDDRLIFCQLFKGFFFLNLHLGNYVSIVMSNIQRIQ